MIFKEESILLMILLEAFTQMIGSPSRKKVMPMVMPLSFRSEKWVPKRVDFKEEGARESEGSSGPLPSSKKARSTVRSLRLLRDN